ncbi:cysteine dioxygenase type 1 isoform X1 [Folsomia candida]|uniref:cysteine dioxygenase type 1 isoform X1 n=1 Tax=Folsomia candida TaxID=158441 RepID=UPI000B8F51A6|nr:cysteine dioxygenase type 1 isoform X1 [Folsomia candida]
MSTDHSEPLINSLDELILHLREAFSTNDVNIEHVEDLMSKSDPRDWNRLANYAKCPYTKNLVDEGNGKYDLVLVCWSEGEGYTGSPIHDHSGSHCFMKILQGILSEVRFAWPESKDNKGLHQMENASKTEQAASLHLYIPPIRSCHTFDGKTSHKTKCEVTFWSKYGKRE